MNINSDWIAPTEFPDLSDREKIAIDLETCDPGLLKDGPGLPKKIGAVIGIALAANGFKAYYPLPTLTSPQEADYRKGPEFWNDYAEEIRQGTDGPLSKQVKKLLGRKADAANVVSEDLNVKNAAGETVPFITQDTFNNFKQLITLGRTLQNFKGTTEQAQLLEESIKKNTEGMFILNKLTRVFGARTGANVFRFFGMGGTLQAPSIGADIAVRQFEKYFPSLFARNIFVKAVTDPQVMADLLSSSIVNNKYTGKNLLKLLNAAGIEYGEGISEEISRPSYEPPREELRAVPQNVTQAPIAPQQVAMATPPPAPKPDMASRARFQQLFPMDIASQTMTQTAPPMQSGIGSLV